MDQNEEGLQYISDKNIPDLLEVMRVGKQTTKRTVVPGVLCLSMRCTYGWLDLGYVRIWPLRERAS